MGYFQLQRDSSYSFGLRSLARWWLFVYYEKIKEKQNKKDKKQLLFVAVTNPSLSRTCCVSNQVGWGDIFWTTSTWFWLVFSFLSPLHFHNVNLPVWQEMLLKNTSFLKIRPQLSVQTWLIRSLFCNLNMYSCLGTYPFIPFIVKSETLALTGTRTYPSFQFSHITVIES